MALGEAVEAQKFLFEITETVSGRFKRPHRGIEVGSNECRDGRHDAQADLGTMLAIGAGTIEIGKRQGIGFARRKITRLQSNLGVIYRYGKGTR